MMFLKLSSIRYTCNCVHH